MVVVRLGEVIPLVPLDRGLWGGVGLEQHGFAGRQRPDPTLDVQKFTSMRCDRAPTDPNHRLSVTATTVELKHCTAVMLANRNSVSTHFVGVADPPARPNPISTYTVCRTRCSRKTHLVLQDV